MIRAVRVLPDCFGCGACGEICPDVFRPGRRARVVGGPEDFAVWETTLLELEDLCPVGAIEVERGRSPIPRPSSRPGKTGSRRSRRKDIRRCPAAST